MEAQEFAGRDGFVWFTGIIEGRADPAMVGRVQVRIIGWHDDNKNLVPTKDLPWAQILLPVTGQRSFSVPKEGEWVFGFFQDGKNGQMPVILGVYPGVITNQTTYINQKGFGIVNSVVEKAKLPAPPAGVVGDVSNEPTTPRIARKEMQGTIVNKMNNDLAKACDFKLEVQKNTALKDWLKAAAKKIREAIRWVIKALGLSDVTGSYSWVINTLKAYAREIRRIQKEIIQPVLDFQKYVLAYIVKLRAIVQWILGLPEKLLQLLQSCLKSLLKAIASIMTDITSGSGGSEDSLGFDKEGWQELTDSFKDAANATSDLLNDAMKVVSNTVAIPVAATAGLLDPVSDAELAEANKFIADYEKSSDNKVPSQNEGLKAP